MNADRGKLEKAVLGLLYLNYNSETGRAWKSFDWDVMDRLHEKGLIGNPKSKNKSVWLSESGVSEAKKSFEELFSN